MLRVISIKFSQIFKQILNCNLLIIDIDCSLCFPIVVIGSLGKRIKMIEQIEALINAFSESPNRGTSINTASTSINEDDV